MIVAGGAILFFFVFLFVYSILYFITLSFFKEPVPGPIKFLIFILTCVVFYSYFAWEDYVRETNEKERRAHYKNLFLKELQDVPLNAEVWASYDTFHASTDSLKNEEGKQSTFKWGYFELISLDAPYSARREAKAISLTQPKELPNDILCGKELNFVHNKSSENGDSFSPESFLFSHCNVDKLNIYLSKQEIQLNNAILYYKNDTEKGYEPDWIEVVKQAAAQLGLTEYWFTRLKGQVRIEKEWVGIDDMGILFDETSTPIALAVSAAHQTGLGNMHLKQCLIKPSLPVMILTNLQDENPTLLTDGLVDNSLSPDCPNIINVAFIYYPDTFESSSNKKESLLQPFSHINDYIGILWDDKYPRLSSLWSNSDEHSFFWGKLNIKRFQISLINKKKEVTVHLTDNSPIKLGNFACRREAVFGHNDKPSDNSLAYENFTLVQCDINEGILFIKNHPIKINRSKLAYFYPNEQYPEKISDFKGKTGSQITQVKSEMLKLELMEYPPILNVAGNQFYLKQAVINTKGDTVALLGEIKEMKQREGIILGKCKYEDYSLTLILKNFLGNDVDVSISTYYPSSATLINTEDANLCESTQTLPYHILTAD